ncbi:crop [Symbiodinium necroappetens]|uniref:Crop protein n=1 Tax=Symbiodinium necroappetens TaxID=1628268 RepID=A0A812PR08_9DINO|nr:crop [Symbiodinium necroappetens]
MVNRGHLPAHRLDRATRPEVPTWVRVRGVLEEGEIPNLIGRYARVKNRPDKNQFLYLIAPELAENANARNHEECSQALVTAIDKGAHGQFCPRRLGRRSPAGFPEPAFALKPSSSAADWAMNRNKALLDALMGANRDASKKDKLNSEPEFKKDEYCKSFLVGYCPGKTLGREVESLRAEFDPKSVIPPCNKLHSIGVREEFKAHKDYQKYKRRYEDDLLHLIDKGIREVEDKVAREKRRHTEGIAVMTDQDRLCEICGLKYKLRFADINVRETEGGKYKPDIHPESDYHKNYVKLREKQIEYEKIIKARSDGDDKAADKESCQGSCVERTKKTETEIGTTVDAAALAALATMTVAATGMMTIVETVATGTRTIATAMGTETVETVVVTVMMTAIAAAAGGAVMLGMMIETGVAEVRTGTGPFSFCFGRLHRFHVSEM